MTSYQKIKAENKKLREIIVTLIINPDSADAHHIKLLYKIQIAAENAIMFGSPTIQSQSKTK